MRLNRPEVGNAVDMPMALELADAFRSVGEDVRVIHLTATGKVFCAGGDVGAFAGAEDVAPFVESLAHEAHRAVRAMQSCPVPIVATVNGNVGGVGLGIVAAADVAICAPGTRFRPAYIALGLTPDGGLTSRLVHTLGRVRALDLLLTDGVLSADDARAAGLVSRVCDDPDQESDAVIAQLLAGPSAAYARLKQGVTASYDVPFDQALDREAADIGWAAGSTDGREAISAFMARRRT